MKGLPLLEKANMSILIGLLLLQFVLHHIFLMYFSFPFSYIFHFASFTKINFPNRGRDIFLFGLVFPSLDCFCP